MCATIVIIAASLYPAGWPFLRRQQSPTLKSKADTLLTEAARLVDGRGAQRPASALPTSLFDLFMVSENATRLERRDWGRDLGAAFENFRIPAALVAGSALTAAFAMLPTPADEVVPGILKRLYLVLSITAFSSAMVTVALSTCALVQLNQQHGGHTSAASGFDDFMARAGYSLELWVAVNAHFAMGLVSLCLAAALRCWVEVADRAFGRIAALVVGSGLSLAVSLGLPNGAWDILVSLPYRYLRMTTVRAFDLRRPAPALIAAVLLGGLATGLTAKELFAFYCTASGSTAGGLG